ncbi:protein trapped in endoderm-1-like [Saccostrea echinata]|uniref:protein trapped in endoderm-1-like n=1 Tax=Saccostrea echinata TaxID=191078 RepID=UPI002A81DC96|nr:protein trapped in endoderm-1-like [Saccostrea echinata]
MAWNRSVQYRKSGVSEITWNLTLHKITTLAISSMGTIINLVAIFVIVKGGLHRQRAFTFVLNLFIGNLLMCSVAFPLYSTPAFSPVPQDDINCPFSGYILFTLTGSTLLNLVLIAINRYVLIVRFTYYETIYRTRNTRIILAVAWLFYPIIYSLPLSELWGKFQFDQRRLFCSPLKTDDGFPYFVLIVSSITAFPSLTFCYIEIVRKIRSSNIRVNDTQSENTQRQKNERQLRRSVLVTISIFCGLNIPVIVVSIVDPKVEKLDPQFHFFFIYVGMLDYIVNTLIYSFLNQQIKSSFLNTFRWILKTNRTEPSRIRHAEIQEIS